MRFVYESDGMTQDWINILSDPDRSELERMMNVGEFVTWPKVMDSILILFLFFNIDRNVLVTYHRE